MKLGGYGNVIEVTRFKDKSIMVKDYGRGIPLDYNLREEIQLGISIL